MDYKHSIAILADYIKEIEDVVLGLEQSKKIPAIDVDLLLDKTRNFYEMLLMLRKNAIEEERQTPPVTNQETQSPVVEKTVEPVIELPTIQPPLKEVPKEINIPVKSEPGDQKILSDRFHKSKSSLNETINQGKSYHDISSKLQSKPITNISEAIGLNEKFAFIHRLFRGDANRYNETIHYLNNAPNFNEAYNYLNENFDWDMDGELVQKILDLIRRKFIVNKNG
jgi:hypothetical protein